eukprot:9497242-Pyramimonas_sp.AAC.1
MRPQVRSDRRSKATPVYMRQGRHFARFRCQAIAQWRWAASKHWRRRRRRLRLSRSRHSRCHPEPQCGP